MGLFDGYDGRSEEGLGAPVKVLRRPVILVVDASATSRAQVRSSRVQDLR